MILDQHFERILVISLPQSAERAARALGELRGKHLSHKAEVFRAIDGRISLPSEWWQAGPGAWGCMMSHFRAVQDALLDGVESLLLIEDDAVWQNDAARLAGEFLADVPEDWGQIYFGGQHRNTLRPTLLEGKPAVMKARSIHRTHAYAVSKRVMAKFLQHILYAPDYLDANDAKHKDKRFKSHVDHQLERAQRRGDWPVYCPSFWLAGQGENTSLINGREQREQWWHLSLGEAHRRMPLVICDRLPTSEEMRHLHFGKHVLTEEPWTDEGVRDAPSPQELRRIMEMIAQEALGCQRLPALCDLTGSDPKIGALSTAWYGKVLRLSTNPDLATIRDFPSSREIPHDWINPSHPPRLPAEPSESTDETVAREKGPPLHQVWIGSSEMPPRLQAYCDTIRKAFPGWTYKLWTEADMRELSRNAVFPAVVMDSSYPLGLRADIVRLEILRQHGGVYFDSDFEALHSNLSVLFSRPGTFYYGDQKSGRPCNAMMAATMTHHPFIEFYLRRIAAVLHIPKNIWETIDLTGPGKLAESLNLWVGEWKDADPLSIDGEQVGNYYASGSIAAIWQEILYPYHYTKATWAAFDPANFPVAWAAHHWEGGWNRGPK